MFVEYGVNKSNSNKLSVTSISTNETKVTVPTSIVANGKKYWVTGIAARAMKGNASIKKLVIGKNINTVGKAAFANCKNLKTITIKGKLKTVGKNAFKGISKKAVIKVDLSKSSFKITKKAIQKSVIAKTVRIKRI